MIFGRAQIGLAARIHKEVAVAPPFIARVDLASTIQAERRTSRNLTGLIAGTTMLQAGQEIRAPTGATISTKRQTLANTLFELNALVA